MMKRSVLKIPMVLLIAAVIFSAAAVLAWAVPARPDVGGEGAAAACRSHPGALVTLDEIPARRGGAHRVPSKFPTEKDIPLLTIVIGFAEMPYENDWNWHETIFSGEKSLSAYYSDMSFGQFTFTPAAETSAFGVGGNTNGADDVNDGVIHVSLPSRHRDWGGENEYPSMAQAFLDAIDAADAFVDFASFDADGDGKISNDELALGFIVAGYEASATYSYSMGRDNYLWAHAWSISDLNEDVGCSVPIPSPDGVSVDAYIAIAEHLDAETREPISVLAHELGHYLGLPDLYDTSANSREKWGKYDASDFSVMASGSWGVDPDGGYCPYSMDVWSRVALGWTQPVTADRDGGYSVAAQSYTQDDAFSALYLPTAREKEYYLIENRQFVKWDAGLAGDYEDGGLIVWHIDDAVYDRYNETNQVNDTFHRPAVMPLYPEQKNDAYTYLGMTDRVLTKKPFYSASAWSGMFAADAPLDLPLYGEGEDADLRDARTLSGRKLYFIDDSAPVMTVRFSSADHEHVMRAVPAAEPGCTAPGVKAHWECEVCGACFAEEACLTPEDDASLAIPAAGHSFGKWAVTVAPGCETAGEKARVCGACGKTERKTLKATGHSFGEWRVTAAPDCENDGVETRVCGVCDKEETRPLDALGHTAPNADGNCERCGKHLVDVTDPSKLCPLCGKDHSGQLFGGLIRLFHRIVWFFRNLF